MKAPKEIKKLTKRTLSGQIAEQIRDAILDGRFALGAQLNEMELASRFGVSRGPVREAMQRLIQEGLLHSEPHRGVFVLELTDEDLIDIFFVRQSIEIAAMRQIMSHKDRLAVCRVLVPIVNKMEQAVARQDWPRVAELDMDFHRELVSAASSPRLSRVYATVQAETKLCLHKQIGGYSGSKALIEEHKLIADLIAGGDLDAAVREISRHFGDPIRILRKAQAARQEQASEAAA
jgi:DNA-binding GntR family transcriptional regulator